MTAERWLIIKQLLGHPCGVGPVWTKQLLAEISESITFEPPEKKERGKNE